MTVPAPSPLPQAVGALGNALSRDVLHHLATDGPATRGELATACDVHPQAVNKALLRLEAVGLVRGDHPVGRRTGRRVYYTLERDNLARTLHALTGYVLGH